MPPKTLVSVNPGDKGRQEIQRRIDAGSTVTVKDHTYSVDVMRRAVAADSSAGT